MEALRELLLNCIVHRDYKNFSDIVIKNFDDKIVFTNPGCLYGNLKLEDLKRDDYVSSIRNKLLAEAFYLTGDIERYGTGFVRIRKSLLNPISPPILKNCSCFVKNRQEESSCKNLLVLKPATSRKSQAARKKNCKLQGISFKLGTCSLPLKKGAEKGFVWATPVKYALLFLWNCTPVK